MERAHSVFLLLFLGTRSLWYVGSDLVVYLCEWDMSIFRVQYKAESIGTYDDVI